MRKILDLDCRKCGGPTSVHWVEPEKSSGMDIEPLKEGGLERRCKRCSFEEFIDDLESFDNYKAGGKT